MLGLLGFLGRHMINLAVGEILRPLRMLLLIGSLVRLPGGIVLSHMTGQSTLNTHEKLDLLAQQHSSSVALSNERPAVHFARPAA
jgi:hypothetical protein